MYKYITDELMVMGVYQTMDDVQYRPAQMTRDVDHLKEVPQHQKHEYVDKPRALGPRKVDILVDDDVGLVFRITGSRCGLARHGGGCFQCGVAYGMRAAEQKAAIFFVEKNRYRFRVSMSFR